ncbi:M4 family metallopeptidase [Pseudoduganella umbonata]|uniref:Neutral metalloproteinase n=1 Tax=Pseudoduganella umbonata TaxID=864828 RepID=A0A4P8HNJ8_9BURK|nr:M4 family metallopeptidase [Pseudoduganella umbonata]MBB3220001.1 Zn-dependent metalloprotease [Pseudoduganella umbonata]QCP10008.1 peptidase M4 family protein [Pseudoduganella umbonata]
MSTAPHRHSIHCFLPPHILTEIAKNGTEPQRRFAIDTLSVDNSFRNFRATNVVSGAQKTMRGAMPGTTAALKRTIYDANNEQSLPGNVVRTEGSEATGDASVDEAYDGLGATYELFLEGFKRNSIDDAGMPLDATVHYDVDYDNAFWNGSQMVFGDGDGTLFNRFTASIDVIGHELCHGVTEVEAGLVYQGQSGALNESISDVFGSLVKQYGLKQQADEADWLIGAQLFLEPGPKRQAIRSMKAPGTAYDDDVLGKDPQPGHMDDYVVTVADNGGVHINSGIPNRAFYLAAVAIGGFAWERAGKIWYDSLLDARLKPKSTFAAFAKLTVSNAQKLFGADSDEAKAVSQAWKDVGVL